MNKGNTNRKTLCVISKEVYGEYAIHDIQTNSAWSSNPYENYAVVPEDMVEAIIETCGFCDVLLNEEGTEVISFKAREIPYITYDEPEIVDDITWDSLAQAIAEGVNEL